MAPWTIEMFGFSLAGQVHPNRYIIHESSQFVTVLSDGRCQNLPALISIKFRVYLLEYSCWYSLQKALLCLVMCMPWMSGYKHWAIKRNQLLSSF